MRLIRTDWRGPERPPCASIEAASGLAGQKKALHLAWTLDIGQARRVPL